jgi:hypothetical protein
MEKIRPSPLKACQTRNVFASSGRLNRLSATVSQVVHGAITEEAGTWSWSWLDGGEVEEGSEDE